MASVESESIHPTNATPRACTAALRRAVRDDDPSVLLEALAGWTGRDVDISVDSSGKSLLHHAAWRGTLTSVRTLLELGACVDRWSDGEHNYGKTPIFYATTRCRDDVVTLLLERGALVRIVNNKGQTPLSLASSHLRADTVELIRLQEGHDPDAAWLNFRETHSDGLLYGDLDPRFCGQAAAEALVTPLAINPTTRTSRRGNFERLNPSTAATGPKPPRTKKASASQLDGHEEGSSAAISKPAVPSAAQVTSGWLVLEKTLAAPAALDTVAVAADDLLRVSFQNLEALSTV
ncbi:hypothetical protein CYMTET_54787 [Cymbomonas tetramitiformis]|uniref:Uncharacterized protein n=1 Tax=Cymbomonas tetramitiformis TaxID=36881 RepID=A0AAE0BE69_9CHLO|nr:hypothetical protein CYMTET_54787 [Cymbomonas tetramitiformis]|eukprot:gene7540-8977_t